MLFVHRHNVETGREGEAPRLDRRLLQPGQPIPRDVVWIDLVEPTPDEDRLVERYLDIAIPTREDMKDIEPSELLYHEDGARFMTARLAFNADTRDPGICAVTFILKNNTLVSVRYDDPKAFHMFANRAAKPGGCGPTAEEVLAGLVDTVIDRAAEVLQQTGDNIDRLSRQVFRDSQTKRHQRAGIASSNDAYRATLESLGLYDDLISKCRESLVSIERVLLYLSVAYRTARVSIELREQVRSTLRDLQSLEEHASFLSNKIQFLLEATLGLVNLEQNKIIKLFSVVSVIFMPPTLVASIYGMNFEIMPELKWPFGYPVALLMMLAAAITPYLLFRWKRWL